MKYNNVFLYVILSTILVKENFSCPAKCSAKNPRGFLNYESKIPKIYSEDLCESNSTSLKITGSNILNRSSALIFKNVSVFDIQFLDLSNNNITYVDFNAFCDFECLYMLTLSHNQIKQLQFENRSCEIPHLHKINLEYNNITKFNFSLLKVFPALGRIHLSFNQISEINECQLEIDLESVGVIILSNNKIEKIHHKALSCLRKLVYLDLENNHLTKIDSRVFQNLTCYLRFLYLSHNKIKSIDKLQFIFTVGLAYLDLSWNELKTLHPYILQMLSKLNFLAIEGNQIQNLNVHNVIVFPHLETILLDNNPWNCNNLSYICRAFQEQRVEVYRGTTYNESNVLGMACENNAIETKSECKSLLLVNQVQTIFYVEIVIGIVLLVTAVSMPCFYFKIAKKITNLL